MFSDNGKSFVGAARWLKHIQSDEKVHSYLSDEGIAWSCSLSRAPWWGGQFEGPSGLFKRAFNKTIGGGLLSRTELSEVFHEVETQLTRRPLSYVEDDVQLPLLTPASFLFQRSIRLPEQEPWREENVDLRRRAKYLKSCKDAFWKRWSREYLSALRECHNCKEHGKPSTLKVGDVVIVRGDERNRGNRSLCVLVDLFEGHDGIVRAARLRAGKSFLERPVQHLFPLELACHNALQLQDTSGLNPEPRPSRSRRVAAVAAGLKIQDAFQEKEM